MGNNIFQSKNNIGSFREFGYFTKITSLPTSAFQSSSITAITIPSSCTTLGVHCFYGCTKLTEANLHDDITTFGDRCFYNCRLVTVIIPKGVTTIPVSCFGNNSTLESVSIHNQVTSVGASSFSSAKMTIIDYPGSVVSIGNQVHEYGHLVSMIVRASVPPAIGSNVFRYGTTPSSIYVPDGSVDTYKAANGWTSYANKIKPLSEYTG